MPEGYEAGADLGPLRLYGKYRGTVIDNAEEDPTMRMLHRIKVSVPQVPSADASWALPCFPYAGEGVGFYTLPPVGASVWVEFEGGNPDFPIWSGCFWDELEFVKPSEENLIDPAMVKMIVTENTEFPPNSIIAGVPAKVVATRDMSAANTGNAEFYRLNAINYANGIERMSPEQMQAIKEASRRAAES